MTYALIVVGGVLGYLLVMGARVARAETAALVAVLISKGLITRAEYEGALEYQRKGGR